MGYQRKLHAQHWILLGIVCIALSLQLWGIKKDLPYLPEADETYRFVSRSIAMAASGDWNPGWFGNPGSTMLYPLSAISHIWHAAVYQGAFFSPDPDLQTRFAATPAEFHLLGRLLSIAYAVMTIPVVYLLGGQAFGKSTGLIGAFIFSLYPLIVNYAQWVRSDSAATFWGALSLWLCLRLYDKPTLANQFFAGVTIGLSIASRYFMVTLIPIYLMVNGIRMLRQPSSTLTTKTAWAGVSIGLLAIVASFALSTPYFFLDFNTALNDLRFEARNDVPGQSGLSPLENFLWYCLSVIPENIGLLQSILVLASLVLIALKRPPKQLILFAFIALYLVGLSLSPLHWERWTIQVFPLLALFAAHGLESLLTRLSRFKRLEGVTAPSVMVLATLVISVYPLYNVVMLDIRNSNVSTHILAYEWVQANLPAGAKTVIEKYTIPLTSHLSILDQPWSGPDRDIADYYRDGYRYIIINRTAGYDRFVDKPDLYPSQLNYYQALMRAGYLLQSFEPSTTRRGPVIEIYQLKGL